MLEGWIRLLRSRDREEAVSSIDLRRWAPLHFTATALAALLLYAHFGSQEAARGDRVLSSLDPAVNAIRSTGGDLTRRLFQSAPSVAGVVTGAALLLVAASLVTARRRAIPLACLAFGAALSAWGQVLLWRGTLGPGASLYVAGMVCAAVAGVLRPMERLPAFAPLPATKESQESGNAVQRPMALAEWRDLLCLTLLGLVCRGYALTELPNFFDAETVGVMAGSYTGYGIRNYMMNELLGTGNGVLHVSTLWMLLHVFGPSVFSVRLAALVWSVAAIPLLYWLVRRLGGRTAALAATLLFTFAPEQLYWGRNENSFYAPVMVLSILTAHMGLTLVRRLSAGAAVGSALLMPLSRFSYTPSFVLFTFPLLLMGHTALFVRGAWRRLHVVVPILMAGLLLWVFSLSAVEYALARENGWRFIHPARIKGESAWKSGMPADTSPLEIVRRQAIRVTQNAGHVLAGMTYHASYSSHWYVRAVVDPRCNTSISAGLAVLCALGVGYLLGQPQDRRAALLLGWVVLGLLPGCMSDEPEARRISIVFPALAAIAGVFAAASLDVIRETASRWVARAAAAGVGAVLLLTAFTSLASHLLVPLSTLRPDADMRFSRALFARCNVVLHNLEYRDGHTVELGNLDQLLRAGPPRCSQLIGEEDWLGAALAPRCDFSDVFFDFVFSREEREARAKALRPGRVGYLLRETREGRPHIELLKRLYPSAETRELTATNSEEALFAVEVPISDIERLRVPENADRKVRGSLLLPADGWYRFRLEPACAGARLSLGTPLQAAEEAKPMLAGVHPFEIDLPSSSACAPRWSVRAEESGRVTAPLLLSRRVAEQAPTQPVLTTSGWGAATLFTTLSETPSDIGVDGAGDVFVLLKGQGAWEVKRFAPDGKLAASFRTGLPLGDEGSIAVDSDGTCVTTSLFDVEIDDNTGRRLATWKVPYDRPPSDLAIGRDGRILICLPRRNSVELFSRAGSPEGMLRLDAGPEPMSGPSGIAVSPDGSFLVVDERGRAHVFKSPAGRFAPQRVASFPVIYPEVPFVPDLKACAFDGPDRLLFPHRSRSVPLVYSPEGRRLLPAQPDRDLSARGFTRAYGFAASGQALYVMDSETRSVYKMGR